MLSIHGLCKSFSILPEPILDNINLELEEGEFCVIIGSNGSGKSTLLKTISGEYKADSGEIFLGAKSISSLSLCMEEPQ